VGLYVAEYGTGSPVVLLNGCASLVEHMEPLARALAPRWRVLLPFFPGYGRTPRHVGAYSFDVDRTLLEEALLARGAGDLAGAVGVSLGGYRALALACGGRVKVRAVVTLGGFAELSDEERAMMKQFAGLAGSRAIPAGIIAQRFLSTAFAGAHPDVAREVDAWPSQIDPEALADELFAVATCEDLRMHLGTLDIPIMARVGDADIAVPLAHSKAICIAAKKGELQVVPGAGHLLLVEDADGTRIAAERTFANA
jgi:3-oxoadipate enol-lactonase